MEHQSISTRIVHQKAHRLPPSIAPGSSMSSASLCRSSMKQTQASCGSMRASIDAPQAINRMTTKVGWEGWGILRFLFSPTGERLRRAILSCRSVQGAADGPAIILLLSAFFFKGEREEQAQSVRVAWRHSSCHEIHVLDLCRQ